jgi:predicted RNA binding protein YcfA (HicA-like mRNA interferase family)
MSSQYPPLTYKEVTRGLSNLGFTPRKKTGTSHEQWVKIKDKRLYKVTVDSPQSPFSRDLIKSMYTQAGVSKDVFYNACSK